MDKDEEKVDYKYNLKEYFNLVRRYKFVFVILLLAVLILEASYVVDRLLFKIIIDKGTEFTSNEITSNIYTQVLILVAITFIFILIIRSFLNFTKLHLMNNVEMEMITDLKRKYFNHIIHLSHRFHTSHKTGSLISRLIRGGHAVERLTDVLVFNTAPLVFQLIVVPASLLYFSVKSSIIVVLTIVTFITYSLLIQNKQKKFNIIMNKKEDLEKAYISDVMTNIDSIKYFGKEEIIKSKFSDKTDQTKNATVKFWNYFRFLDAGEALILGLGVFFMLYFPLISFLDGELTIGSLVFIYTVYGNMIGPLFGFIHGIRNYYRAMSDLEDLFQYGKIENDVKDKKGAKELKIIKGDIEFKNVNFSYHKRSIFKDFSLRINKNEKIALVGHSGSGKTTLVKLLYRLHNLDKGEILIDGKNITEFKQESLRSELSIVPQECVLFDDTIYDNIAFSKPNATREEIIKAMKFAQLDKTIKDFPNKEKTIVGERGVKLSGGEKQRVSIARAILANKKILVLDEATSSLDSQTEHEIQKALQELMKNRTSIIIAHRLSTIMHADRIVVLAKGKIVQIGTHKDLIKIPGTYRNLWDLQKGGYIK